MTANPRIIEMSRWLSSPMGSYVLQWEQFCVGQAVMDAFGYHALQLGLPELDALRENRMPHRWLALRDQEAVCEAIETAACRLKCDFDALPFPSQSLDLVVLPHALELSSDPHLTLAEVERVLVPEGRVMILGFNPHSLWGWSGRWQQMIKASSADLPSTPPMQGALAYRRVRDWLRLLSFEVEDARFGCWRPAVASAQWLDRLRWWDRVGERWWPVLGGVYFITAVKRVRGMRLVGLARWQSQQRGNNAAVVTSLSPHQNSTAAQEPSWITPHE